MTAPPGFHPEHLGEQSRRLALRNVREIGDKANRIAALVAGGEIAPSAVESVHLERAEIAIGPARIERDNFRADTLAARQEPRQTRPGRPPAPLD